MNQKLLNVGAMLLVGDGLLTAFRPRRETQLWKEGPKPYRAVMERVSARPNLARVLALMELGLGIWLASRQCQAVEVASRSRPRERRRSSGERAKRSAPETDLESVSEDLLSTRE